MLLCCTQWVLRSAFAGGAGEIDSRAPQVRLRSTKRTKYCRYDRKHLLLLSAQVRAGVVYKSKVSSDLLILRTKISNAEQEIEQLQQNSRLTEADKQARIDRQQNRIKLLKISEEATQKRLEDALLEEKRLEATRPDRIRSSTFNRMIRRRNMAKSKQFALLEQKSVFDTADSSPAKAEAEAKQQAAAAVYKKQLLEQQVSNTSTICVQDTHYFTTTAAEGTGGRRQRR